MGVAGCRRTHSFRSLKAPSPQDLQWSDWGCYLGELGSVSMFFYGRLDLAQVCNVFKMGLVSGSVSMSRVRSGLPCVISKRLNLIVVLGAALTLRRAIGSRRYHGSDVS